MPEGNVAKQALDALKVKRAMDMRVRGAHWREIADTCGYASPAAALKAVGAMMADATMRAEETADTLRDTANLQLDMLLNEALGMLEAETFYGEGGNALDDRPTRLRAIDEARRLIESKAKLNQLDKVIEEQPAVQRIEIVGLDPQSLV